MEPLVSVVIPTYGRPKMLLTAVKSVLDQTYSNIELLIADDHSPVSAKETLSSVLPTDLQSVRIIRHDENKGANVARNTGIRNASGEFIAFLDDDDKWEPTKLQRQVITFQKTDDDVGVVYTGQRLINDEGTTTSLLIPRIKGDVTKQLLYGADMVPFSSVMVRSDVIQQAGLPDERFPCWQDREWYVRLSQYCDFEPIPEPLAIRHIGDHDQISDDYMQRRDDAYPLFLEKHQPLAAEYGRICERKMKSSLIRELGKHALRQKNHQESQKQLIKSIVHYPLNVESYLYLLVSLSGGTGYRIGKRCKQLYENHRA